MEKRINEYEKYITEAIKHPTPELKQYHNEMVRNFQHERAVHLAIMLFFIAITIIVMVGAAFAIAFATTPFIVAVSILAMLLAVLSIAYVKHYYFLENHIQKLYDITTKLYKQSQ